MAGRTSFKSYVSEATSAAKKQEKLVAAYEKMYQRPDPKVEKLLLPGEIITGHAKKVIKYSPFDDPVRGVSGSLLCTNFRVMFVATDQPKCDLNELNSHLLGKQDIALNNIDSLFVEYPSKRKRLVPTSKVKQGIQRLEIHCKDFRVSAFNFKLTVKYEEQGIVKAILHHSYPSSVSLLFAFDYQHELENLKVHERGGVPSYRSYADWQALLRKHDVEDYWRVTSVNQQFSVTETMSEYFVVPRSIKDNRLKTAANQFINNRLPIWCWSATNRCSLVRSAELRADTELGGVEKEIFSEVQQSDGDKCRLKVLDSSKLCPSITQIQQSFNKLKNLCLINSLDDFYGSDSSWFASLQGCRWMQLVSAFIAVAVDAVEWIVAKQHNLVIKEHSGVDSTPVLTSLIQLIADPSCRTIIGFQELIQREWVVGGFPFLDRLGHLFQPTKSKGNSLLTLDSDSVSNMSPVFLMFLDCVWQLTRQNPSAFEFSSIYLAALHDSTRLAIFDSFIFNNERHRHRSIHSVERDTSSNPCELIPVWDWSLQFDGESRKLFSNPLYRFAEMKLPGVPLPRPPSVTNDMTTPYSLNLSMDSLDMNDDPPSPTDEDSPPSPDMPFIVTDDAGGVQLHYDSRTGAMTSLVVECNDSITDPVEKKKRNRFSIRARLIKEKSVAPSPPPSSMESGSFRSSSVAATSRPSCAELNKDEVLSPNSSLPALQLWSFCYFRWLTWSQMFGGAPAATFQRESRLYDEVHALNQKISLLKKQLGEIPEKVVGATDDDSGMYFREELGLENSETTMPNFFPYTPVTAANSKSAVGSVFANQSKSGSLFTFSSRNRPKHIRSSSDISVPTSCGDEIDSDLLTSSQSLNDFGKERSRSASTQPPNPPGRNASTQPPNQPGRGTSTQAPNPPEQSAKPSKKVPLMPPRKPLAPPKEHVTYVSSV